MPHRSSQFDRKGPRYKAQPRVLILCEDTKSSRYYLQEAAIYFRSHALVEISHSGKNDPLSIVQAAIRRKLQYEVVYCAIDRDSHEKFHEAVHLASTTGGRVRVIASYPCYEFWLLLHFRYTRRPYVGIGKQSAADLVLKDLKKEVGMHNYEKGTSVSPFHLLLEHLPRARDHATRAMAQSIADQSANPSTMLHELIKQLEQLGSPQPIR